MKNREGQFFRKNREGQFFRKNREGQFFRKNRKGWIKIVEAFISIMLVASIFLIVLDKKSEVGGDFDRIHKAEMTILREIQLDNNLRNNILSANPGSSGLTWGSFPNEKVPNYLDCVAKICNVGDLCILQNPPETDVYSESVIISTTLQATGFDPRQLKLFCWKK